MVAPMERVKRFSPGDRDTGKRAKEADMTNGGERVALQEALRGTRRGLCELVDQMSSPIADVLSLIEGELLDLLEPRPSRRRFDSQQPPFDERAPADL